MADTRDKSLGEEKIEAQQVEAAQDAQLGHLADQEDHETGIWNSFVKYPWASAWCIYACWCIILVSFDLQAAGSVIGIPQFRKDFGFKFGDDYVIPAEWQSAFSGAPVATYVFSSLLSCLFCH